MPNFLLYLANFKNSLLSCLEQVLYFSGRHVIFNCSRRCTRASVVTFSSCRAFNLPARSSFMAVSSCTFSLVSQLLSHLFVVKCIIMRILASMLTSSFPRLHCWYRPSFCRSHFFQRRTVLLNYLVRFFHFFTFTRKFAH